MHTPQTPEITTAVIDTYPTPDSIRYRPRKRRALDKPYFPSRDDRIDPLYFPTRDDARDDADKETTIPPGTVAEPKRAPRKGKTVDPVYRPSNETGDSDGDGGSTAKRGTRKRKRAPCTAIEVDLTDKDSFARTIDNTYKLPELPVTPTGPSASGVLGVYPTPSSLNESPLGRRSSFSEPAPMPPRWESDSPVEFNNEDVDPSWDSPKTEAGKRSRSTSRVPDDELYLPSPNTASGTFSKCELLTNGADDGLSDEDDEYLDGCSVSRNETKDVVFDFSLERAKRLAAAVSLPENTWSEAEKELFYRLAMRGFEPLLPRHWQHDFSTLPDTLFPIPEDEKGSLIQALKRSDFHAIKSLASLFSLGGQVRDCSILKTRPEAKIKRAIKRYIRWALHDADLHAKPGAIPVLTIHAQKRGESIVAAVTRLNRRLATLAKRYHGALEVSTSEKRNTTSRGVLRNPVVEIKKESSTSPKPRYKFPLLVGFVICGPIVAILTLDSDPLSPRGWGDGTSSKFISQFDVGERGQDVWTSLAVAITTMHIRETMIHLASDDRSGFYRFKAAMHPDSDEDL